MCFCVCDCSVDGGELFDRIIDENYTLMELDTVMFIREICEGLQHMHKMYILHLDLKVDYHTVFDIYTYVFRSVLMCQSSLFSIATDVIDSISDCTQQVTMVSIYFCLAIVSPFSAREYSMCEQSHE